MSVGCIAQFRTSARDTKDKLGYLAKKFNGILRMRLRVNGAVCTPVKKIKIIMKKPIYIKIFLCAQQ